MFGVWRRKQISGDGTFALGTVGVELVPPSMSRGRVCFSLLRTAVGHAECPA